MVAYAQIIYEFTLSKESDALNEICQEIVALTKEMPTVDARLFNSMNPMYRVLLVECKEKEEARAALTFLTNRRKQQVLSENKIPYATMAASDLLDESK